ncbi:MAG: alpha/beta fold hydrolase [Nocardioidaceae bacterium]|nr:alpha/beta fold hydrolase [Nocardioidaceae bacterium]NUS49429.1 alpha/beta fold hydrolase [Nocardioidaceae bacterium]
MQHQFDTSRGPAARSTPGAPLPIDPNAEPFHADAVPSPDDGQRVGVLLSQGFTGSPASMVPWGRYLAEQGFGVAVPRLPGHGTTWQELNRTRWADWYGEVERAFEKLRADCDQVVVGGLSMGGSLALRLAADRGRDVSGVLLVNPAVNIARKDVLALPVLKHVVPAFPGIADDIKKPGVEEHGYDRTPLKAAHSMLTSWKRLRDDLPRVTQPILMFRSVEDHVVDPSSARIITTTVSSRDVREVLLENSYHVATLDNDAPTIFEQSAEFVRRVTGP